MASCKCGANVDYVRTPDNDALIPLESFTVATGERYRIEDFDSDPWGAVRLDPTSTAQGNPDHRPQCPLQ